VSTYSSSALSVWPAAEYNHPPAPFGTALYTAQVYAAVCSKSFLSGPQDAGEYRQAAGSNLKAAYSRDTLRVLTIIDPFSRFSVGQA